MRTFFICILATAEIHAQRSQPKCGTFVYGTKPNLVVMNVDCLKEPHPPSPWPIIKAIAQPPDNWALARVLDIQSPEVSSQKFARPNRTKPIQQPLRRPDTR
jgi:hypothetical protein